MIKPKPVTKRSVKRLQIEYLSYQLTQPAFDLFGEIPVTESDLYEWVASVSPVHLSERGYDLYVRRYDVAGKVRSAKERGNFETITANRPPPYHARLALHQIV
jgi:hypothetical protein